MKTTSAERRGLDRLSIRYASLFRMCRRRGCSREEAMEIVQQAHLRWFEYERAARVRNVDSLLRRIVINLTITHYNRVRCSPFSFEGVDKLDRRGELVASTLEPEQAAEVEQQLWSTLSPVRLRSRQIFLAQCAGYSYEEIGRAFAIRPRTVEKHLQIAAAIVAGEPSEPPDAFTETSPSGESWAISEEA